MVHCLATHGYDTIFSQMTIRLYPTFKNSSNCSIEFNHNHTMDYNTMDNDDKSLLPSSKDMTRSHLPQPQTMEAIVIDVGSPEAKIIDPSEHQLPPKPADARCRLCDSSDDTDLLIKPCRCDGHSKYVHRDCLNQQRSFNENNRGFMHCRDCEYRYWIDLKESYVPDAKCFGQPQRIWKFRGMVARDTIALFILLQGVIALFGYVVERADSCASLQGCGQGCGDVEPWGYVCGTGHMDPSTNVTTMYGGFLLNEFSIWHLNQHYKTTYYFLGLLFFLATVGCVGCMHSCLWFCASDSNQGKGVNDYTDSCVSNYTCYYCFYDCPCCWSRSNNIGCCCYSNNYHHRSRYRPIGGGHYIGGSGIGGSNTQTDCDCCNGCNCNGCCNGCNCSGCKGGDCKGGGGDGAAVLLVIAVVVFVILVMVGFIYGLILITLVMTKMVQKHYAVAQRRTLTRAYIVRDLDGIFLPSVGSTLGQSSAEMNLPSAPPIDEVELRAFGLL